MRTRTILVATFAGVLGLVAVEFAHGLHRGGFGGGVGSVSFAGRFVDPGSAAWSRNAYQYGAWDGYDPVYGTIGSGVYSQRPANYGSIHNSDSSRRVPGELGSGGGAPSTPSNFGATYGGSMDRTAYAPQSSLGASREGPALYIPDTYRDLVGVRAVANLPHGTVETSWKGQSYYRCGYTFYRPCMYAGILAYQPVYPPVGYFFNALPAGATPYTFNSVTYYCQGSVYYQTATQNGQAGYWVVDPPTQGGTAQGAPSSGGSGPDPLQLLRKMSDYLGRQKFVGMKVGGTFDEVTSSGEKIELADERTIQAERPDKLAVSIRGSHAERRMVYDGSSFTMIDVLKNVYTTLPASGSLESMMDQLAARYGLAQPLGDFLYGDIYGRLAGKILAGQCLGKVKVSDHACQHIVFKQADISWQIWIEDGDRSVPWKLVISYDKAPGRPQFTAVISHWAFAAPSADERVTIAIPKDARKVEMVELFGAKARE